MNKSEYDNGLRKQCMSLPELCEPQIQGVLAGLGNALTEEELKKVGSILITGCGDSFVAARAGVAAFKHFANAFGFTIESMSPIDAARFHTFLPANNLGTLVIGISASGGPARVAEVLRRANANGCMTLAITNNADSPVGKEAKRALIVGTPSFPTPNPGLRNYYASITALYLLAARMGEVKGRCPAGSVSGMAEAIRQHTRDYASRLDAVDDSMFSLAQAWRDFPTYDFIGDDLSFCAAYFGAAKLVETAGVLTKAINSEDWCHVHFFQRNAAEIGTVITADVHGADLSRVRETIHQARGIDRPLLLVTNGAKEDFSLPDDAAICTLPDAPEGFPFMRPLLDYIPSALLAGYVSALHEEPYFRGGGVWAEEGVGTIRSSRIEIV